MTGVISCQVRLLQMRGRADKGRRRVGSSSGSSRLLCCCGRWSHDWLVGLCAGRNWGDVDINSSSLLYRVDNKAFFEVPLPDVAQAQQTKVDAQLANSLSRSVLGEMRPSLQ